MWVFKVTPSIFFPLCVNNIKSLTLASVNGSENVT